jgi:hypothetical protein
VTRAVEVPVSPPYSSICSAACASKVRRRILTLLLYFFRSLTLSFTFFSFHYLECLRSFLLNSHSTSPFI